MIYTDYLVVGAGFAGSIIAERLHSAGKKVIVVEKRKHIGGNAYDYYENGILVSAYGIHAFHTNNKRVFEYLSKFTDWHFYELHIRSKVKGKLYPFPINRTTINSIYKLNLTEDGVKEFLDNVREKKDVIVNSEDVVVSQIGRELCDLFYTNYTKKQWGVSLCELDASVSGRIPVRFNDDDRYFTDTYQFLPIDGYTKMFGKMLDGIEVKLGVSFEEVQHNICYKRLIYTGSIDRYFGYCFGKLPYRSLKFKYEYLSEENFDSLFAQPVAVINYPNEKDYTRTVEFKQMTGQRCNGTVIMTEYPSGNGEPFYPIPNKENQELYKKYCDLLKSLDNVIFIGRLAQYKYCNMDDIVDEALKVSDDLLLNK
jgi:UDP-galactopyranose mutase